MNRRDPVSPHAGTAALIHHLNRLGQLVKLEHGGQVTLRDYNEAGQLLNEVHTGGPLNGVTVARSYNSYLQPQSLSGSIDGSSFLSVQYGYTPAAGSFSQARLQTLSGGPGNQLRFGYTANSHLLASVAYEGGTGQTITRSLQYDFLDRLKQIATTFGDTHTYEFDALDRRKGDTLGDGTRWDYAYDELGQLTSADKTEAGGTASLNSNFAYTSDKIGNLLSVQSPGIGGGETQWHRYNRQNQLTVVPHSGVMPIVGRVNPQASLSVLTSGSFLAVEARQGEDFRIRLNTGVTNQDRYLSFTNHAVVSQPGQADMVTSTVVNRFIPANGSETLTYDGDGNLLSDGRWNYTWDALNRLIKIESKPTVALASRRRVDFIYDAGGRRIQKTEWVWITSPAGWQEVSSTRFVYSGWDLIAELDAATGTPIRTYGWLGKSGGLLWVKDHATGEHHVPSFDGNRNVTRLIKFSDKSISAEYEYEPFGGTLRATGPMALSNPIRFSSEYHDDATGLVYYGYRYYSPHTRRWLSRDPIGFAGGPNLYGFVGNDPVNGRDFYGLYFNMWPGAACMRPEAQQAELDFYKGIGSASEAIGLATAKKAQEEMFDHARTHARFSVLGYIANNYEQAINDWWANKVENELSSSDGYIYAYTDVAIDVAGAVAGGVTIIRNVPRILPTLKNKLSSLWSRKPFEPSVPSIPSKPVAPTSPAVEPAPTPSPSTAKAADVIECPPDAAEGVVPKIRGHTPSLRNPAQVDQIKADMLAGKYRYDAPEGIISGVVDKNGVIHLTEGQHRMNAALEIFEETGNASHVNQLLESARRGLNGRSYLVPGEAPTGSLPLPRR